MPYGYNPAQFINDFSGLEKGLTGAISKAGIAIGDYVKVVSDNKAMDELKIGLIDGHAQQRNDVLGEPIKEAKRVASRLFLPKLKGESNESLFKRWEVAGKNAKQQLGSQRKKQVNKSFASTPDTVKPGPTLGQLGPQLPGQEAPPPEQVPLAPGFQKEEGISTEGMSQSGLAAHSKQQATQGGFPEVSAAEAKENLAFSTAQTPQQQITQKRAERAKDYQSAKLALQEKRFEGKVDSDYIGLQRLWLDHARFDFQKRKEQNKGLDFIIKDTLKSKEFARERVGDLKDKIQEVKSNPANMGKAKELLLNDLENELRDANTAAIISDQNLNFYAKIMRQESGTTGQSTGQGFKVSPPGGGTTQPQQPTQRKPLSSFRN